ncbi:hypothetical protein PHLGIDRAFT_493063 [Phlebiopsis gigantea 11061_1 CR5-6]|uniref:Uncharacterized protein n=1 Tax=Phlebiopsis gigantea (strain 11061_1 CR5-6) TaxID=745531 RepID=A0A0C3S3N7_PHLG1|nr:hypothetical protein PHLGIDRAFT_493063 [Phlebiopsis gigantea 11061_1 CR5-6]
MPSPEATPEAPDEPTDLETQDPTDLETQDPTLTSARARIGAAGALLSTLEPVSAVSLGSWVPSQGNAFDANAVGAITANVNTGLYCIWYNKPCGDSSAVGSNTFTYSGFSCGPGYWMHNTQSITQGVSSQGINLYSPNIRKSSYAETMWSYTDISTTEDDVCIGSVGRRVKAWQHNIGSDGPSTGQLLALILYGAYLVTFFVSMFYLVKKRHSSPAAIASLITLVNVIIFLLVTGVYRAWIMCKRKWNIIVLPICSLVGFIVCEAIFLSIASTPQNIARAPDSLLPFGSARKMQLIALACDMITNVYCTAIALSRMQHHTFDHFPHQ